MQPCCRLHCWFWYLCWRRRYCTTCHTLDTTSPVCLLEPIASRIGVSDSMLADPRCTSTWFGTEMQFAQISGHGQMLQTESWMMGDLLWKTTELDVIRSHARHIHPADHGSLADPLLNA